jgi:hypothetical protein
MQNIMESVSVGQAVFRTVTSLVSVSCKVRAILDRWRPIGTRYTTFSVDLQYEIFGSSKMGHERSFQ